MLDRRDILVGNGKDQIIVLHMLLDTGEEGKAGTQLVVGELEIFHDLSTEKRCIVVIHPTDKLDLAMDTEIQDMMGCIEDHLHHGTKVDQCIMAHLAHQPTITIEGTPGYMYLIEKLDMALLGHSGCIRRVQDQLVHVLQVLWSCSIFSKEYSGRAESHRLINVHFTHLRLLSFSYRDTHRRQKSS